MNVYTGIPEIDIGLNIFFATPTAQNKSKNNCKNGLGMRSAETLKSWAQAGKIKYSDEPILKKGSSGVTWWTGFYEWISVYSVEINKKVPDERETMAMILAHEGVHAYQRHSKLNGEVDAYALQFSVCADLMTGVQVPTGQGTYDAFRISVPQQFEMSMEGQRMLAHDQLIDFILDKDWGTYGGALTSDWVLKHYNDYSGFDNRWEVTQERYIKALIDAFDMTYDKKELILTLLDKYLRGVSNFRQEFIDSLGGRLRWVMEDLKMHGDQRVEKLSSDYGVDFFKSHFFFG